MSMSIAEGLKIGIEFSEKITSTFGSVLGSAYRRIDDAIITAKNYKGATYHPSRLQDGVANSINYWYGTTAANWLICRFADGKVVSGFRWYIPNSSFYPKTFYMYGSNDGSTWTLLGGPFTGTTTIGWQAYTFTNFTAFTYYKIDITASSYSSAVYVSELEFFMEYGNEFAFLITGSEYDMLPEGALMSTIYRPKSVEAYPDNDHAILLTMDRYETFRNVVGNLTVAYNATVGNLAGLGGRVVSFSTSLSPSNLGLKPLNLHDPEHINLALVAPIAVLTRIDYTNAQTGEENIELSGITGTGVLTNINDL